MEKCRACNKLKSSEEFIVGTRWGGAKRNRCRECRNYQAKQRRQLKLLNPEWVERHRTKQKTYYSRPEVQRERKQNRITKKYGISLEEYEAKLLNQNYRCLICRELLDKPQLDHDHQTNQIRGFLCLKCNGLLGMVNDRIELLQSAIDYLAQK